MRGYLLLVTDLTAGPNRVMNVDYESMRVLDGDMPVRMAMWFGMDASRHFDAVCGIVSRRRRPGLIVPLGLPSKPRRGLERSASAPRQPQSAPGLCEPCSATRIAPRGFPALSVGQHRADHGGCEKCGLVD